MQATNETEKNSKAFLLETEPYFFFRNTLAAMPGTTLPSEDDFGGRKFWPGEKMLARGKDLRRKTNNRTDASAAAWGAPGLGIQERMCSVHRDGIKLKSVKCNYGVKCVALQCCTVHIRGAG